MNRLMHLQGLYQKYKKWFTREEENEQINFVFWLEKEGYKYCAIPNSTWTKSIVQQVRNTLMGVVPGSPDMMIILKRGSILFLEMKRTLQATDYRKDGKLLSNAPHASPEQAVWIESLDKIDNVSACLAYGLKEAIEKVQYYETL